VVKKALAPGVPNRSLYVGSEPSTAELPALTVVHESAHALLAALLEGYHLVSVEVRPIAEQGSGIAGETCARPDPQTLRDSGRDLYDLAGLQAELMRVSERHALVYSRLKAAWHDLACFFPRHAEGDPALTGEILAAKVRTIVTNLRAVLAHFSIPFENIREQLRVRGRLTGEEVRGILLSSLPAEPSPIEPLLKPEFRRPAQGV